MPADRPPSRSVEKSSTAFRTISEVAAEVGVEQHVLRFWETRFPQVVPIKRGGNRRYYRPADVELLQKIARLLYHDGYTIKGVQQLLARDGGVEALIATAGSTGAAPTPGPVPAARAGYPETADMGSMPALAAIRAQLAAALAAARAL